MFASTAAPNFGVEACISTLLRRLDSLDDDGLDLAGAAAAECGGLGVLVRGEAGDALLKGRKLDQRETLKLLRAFHDLEAAAARQNLAAVLGEDGRHLIGVFLVLGGIVDPGARDPIGWH